jgi:mannosyltransferase
MTIGVPVVTVGDSIRATQPADAETTAMPGTSDDATIPLPRLPQPAETIDTGPTVVPLDPLDPPDLRELPAPPEPLDAPWLRTMAWFVPTLAATALGVWPTTAGVGATAADGGAMPYAALIDGWTSFAGSSALLLRLPTIAATAASAGLVAVLGVRLAGRRVGLAAGLVFALLPTTSAHAMRLGPEAFAVLLVLLATVLTVRMVDRPGPVAGLGYATALVLLSLVQPLALLVVAAHALIVLTSPAPRGRALAGWTAAASAAGFAIVTLGYTGTIRSDLPSGGTGPYGWAEAAAVPATVFGGPVVAGAVLAMAFLGGTLRQPARVATLYALVPTAGLFATVQAMPGPLSRQLLVTVPAWALLASLTLRRLTIARGLSAVVAVGLLGLPAQMQIRQVEGDRPATAAAAARPGGSLGAVAA